MNTTRLFNRPNNLWLNGCLLALGTLATPSYASDLDTALVEGTPSLEMRLRYESVDNTTNKDASAATLRTRLGYATREYHGLMAYGEFEDVRIIGGLDDYAPVTDGYATVADPEITQLNQAFLGYNGLPQTQIKLGRQRLILDNARFVGNVGWRQNEQTFDAVSLINKSLKGTTITYAYLDKVNGILTTFDADVSDHLLNVKYDGIETLTLTAYAYLLEDDDSGAKNDTYGLSTKGKADLGEMGKLHYSAEFATQSTDNNDASYLFLEAAMTTKAITAKVGYEVLGSDGGAYGFQTPLATKHAFNGWADKFLATPATGLRDLMLTLSGKLGGTKLVAVYHDFSADEGDAQYGSEIDLLAAKKFGKRYLAGLKYSSYSADSYSTDTNKLWVWGQLKI